MTARRARPTTITGRVLLLGAVALPALVAAATVEAASIAESTQAAPLGGVAEVRVSSGTDDAEERTDGSMYLNSSDLEFVTDIDRPSAVQRQMVGLRFAGVDVPVGATVTGAYLEFRVDRDTSSDPTSLLIRGEASTASRTFSRTPGDVRGRPQTAAFVQWTEIEPWTREGEVKRSIDLSPVVKEVISQPGWTAGNPVTLLIDGYGRRVAKSFERSSSEAPLLHIEYTVDGPTDPPPPLGGDAIVSSNVTLTPALSGADWSGLAYQNGSVGRPGVLWAVDNGDSRLARIPDGADRPNAVFPLVGDDGRPIDAEAVTIDEFGRIFVGAEGRNNGNPNAIYQYDVGNSSKPVRSWSFGNVGSPGPIFPDGSVHNKGIEALAWMPYSAFGGASNPYAARGDSMPGFFAIGTETQGTVFIVAIYADVPTRYEVVGTVDTGLAGVMALEWDGRQLWAYCDDQCDKNPAPGGRPAAHFAIMEPNGQQLRTVGTWPTAPSLVGKAMEGFALKSVDSCDQTTGLRQAWWSDDTKSSTALATGFAGRC